MTAAFHMSLAALAMLALAACSNALPEADLKLLAEEARMITNNAAIETTAIENVHPQAIRIETDGVYIRIGGFYVTEHGFFVPLDPAFKPPQGGDPS